MILLALQYDERIFGLDPQLLFQRLTIQLALASFSRRVTPFSRRELAYPALLPCEPATVPSGLLSVDASRRLKAKFPFVDAVRKRHLL